MNNNFDEGSGPARPTPPPVRLCPKGHGELDIDGTCQICTRPTWLNSPWVHLAYGLALATASYYASNHELYEPRSYDSIFAMLMAFTFFAWRCFSAIVQWSLRASNSISRKPATPAHYQRRLHCRVCGSEINTEDWCRECSRKRSRAAVVLLFLVLPLLGASACFSYLTFGTKVIYPFLIASLGFLPPLILSVVQYFQNLPKKQK